MNKFKKILVPIDGSEHSLLAAEYGASLARACGSEMILLHVIPDPGASFLFPPNKDGETSEQLVRKHRKQLKKIIEKIQNQLSAYNVILKTMIFTGDPAFEICRIAELSDVDLIVLGSRGLSEIKEYFLGSVSMRVVRRARRPVLVVR